MSAPCPLAAVSGPETAELTLGDGVVLVADVYRPGGAGPWPVLLMRQPYGRRIASTVVLAHPAWYAAQGYLVVVQDVRGCGDSGGVFEPFVNEVEDGAATLRWARALPGSNGRLGLYGFSYQATTQYLALAGGERPDAMAPAMGSWHPGRDWLRQGGLLRMSQSLGWAVQMARLAAGRSGDTALLDDLSPTRPAAHHYATLMARPDVSALDRWVADDADWWSRAAPAERLDGIALDVPVLHIAGLADFLLGGSLAADAAFRAAAPQTSHLILGPWAHMPWNSHGAGPGAALSVDRQSIAFFDHYLKGIGPRPPAILGHDRERDRWVSAPGWPDGPRLELGLSSGGLAAAHLGDGALTHASAPPAGAGQDRLVHDPTRPVPLIGGAAGVPPGPQDRTALDDRADVATYDTAPFPRDRVLTGTAALHLRIDADADRFVCAASLSLVRPGGAALVLATGAARAGGAAGDTAGPTAGSVRIDLGALSTTVPAGHRLRLSVQGAADPAFALPPDEAPLFAGSHRPVTLTIHHAGSLLSLPPLLQEEPPA